MPRRTSTLFEEMFNRHGTPLTVYSMGGGNAAILDAFATSALKELVFVAHDLDAENRLLLREEKITFVLQHDLAKDIQNVLLAIASRHGLAKPTPSHLTSDIQIVAPYNVLA